MQIVGYKQRGYEGGYAPFREIRRTGFAGPRRIFAEVSLPSGSKNSFLTDLPPGSIEDATGKSAQGVALAGEEFPRQQAHACVSRESSKFSG